MTDARKYLGRRWDLAGRQSLLPSVPGSAEPVAGAWVSVIEASGEDPAADDGANGLTRTSTWSEDVADEGRNKGEPGVGGLL